VLQAGGQQFPGPEVDETHGLIKVLEGRVFDGGVVEPALYAAGWATRSPRSARSHADDAAELVVSLRRDVDTRPRPTTDLAATLYELGVEPAPLDGWSALAATNALLARFDGEGTLPLADYDELLTEVSDD
jgi:hypothetical protein